MPEPKSAASLKQGLSRPKLQRGSRIAVVSPASAARPERVAAGVDALQRFGYQPIVMPHALKRGPLYYAGAAAERAADLMAAFTDDHLDGICCTRGGWGSAELLPLLDAQVVRSHPKVFIGYSDQTSLQSWLWNECRFPSIYGPMVAADWASDDGADAATWRTAVERNGTWCVDGQDGLRVLRPGAAEGRLLGGCLAILEASLGTPWAFRCDEPTVLFLEDIGVKPYQWDRMLQHLCFAGIMRNVQAVVFGDMTACADAAEQDQIAAACLHGLRDFNGPVWMGLRSGHVQGGNRSLPLGAWVRAGADRVMEIDEPFV